jgi:hypothetical protein
MLIGAKSRKSVGAIVVYIITILFMALVGYNGYKISQDKNKIANYKSPPCVKDGVVYNFA